MAFPGPYSSPITNEAGELLGWDNYDPDFEYEPTEEDERRWEAESYAYEDAYEFAQDEGWEDHDACRFADYRIRHGKGKTTEASYHDWVAAREAKLT